MSRILFTVLTFVVISTIISINLAKNLARVKRQSLAYRFADGIDLIVPDLRESFSCLNREYGYYADIDNNCQVFHVCVPPSQHFSFFCPNQTIFDQRLLVCQDEVFATPCRDADQYYIINQNFGVTDPEKLIRI